MVTTIPPNRKYPKRTNTGFRFTTPNTESAVNVPAKMTGISISFSMLNWVSRRCASLILSNLDAGSSSHEAHLQELTYTILWADSVSCVRVGMGV